jgi:hypothetical protein
MDLSTFNLTEEQQTAINALHQTGVDSEVLRLKGKNDELIAERRADADKIAEATRLADEAKQESDLAAARKANDLSSLEETLKTQFAGEKQGDLARYEALQKTVKESKLNAILSDLAPNFISPEAAKLVLRNMISINFGEDNLSNAEYKGFDGAIVATDSKQFIEWAGRNASLASLMKPINSAGGGAGGSNGLGGHNTKPLNKMNEAERLKFKQDDPSGFKKAVYGR